MATTPKTLTYEEWLALPESEGTEEVVKGEIVTLPPNNVIHADIVESLADLLKEKLDPAHLPDAVVDIDRIWSQIKSAECG